MRPIRAAKSRDRRTRSGVVRLVALWLGLASAALTPIRAVAMESFHFAGQVFAPGTSTSFHYAAGGSEIPVTVIHGAMAGPVLTLSAGVHGDEYPAVLALQQLRRDLQPGSLHGTLLLLHVTNVEAFHARRREHPGDDANLNRVFPGRADGGPAERIAAALTRDVVPVTDYLIDLHSGSWTQSLWPHVYAPFVGEPDLDARTLAFARGTGMTDVILYGDRPRDPARSVSWPNTAMTRGKPGLTIEIGHRGESRPEQVAAMDRAIQGALRHLRMVEGDPAATSNATLYHRLVEVESDHAGLFLPKVEVGESVEAGALLGLVTDHFGDRRQELRSPVRGLVLMIDFTPPVRAGEAPVTVAVPE